MNFWLLVSGICAILLCLVHVLPGGREFHRPMVASLLPEPAKAAWSVLWHAMSAILCFGGAGLVAAAFLPNHALSLAVLPITLYLASAVLFIVYGLARLGTLRLLPQWMAFLVISVLGLIGLIP